MYGTECFHGKYNRKVLMSVSLINVMFRASPWGISLFDVGNRTWKFREKSVIGNVPMRTSCIPVYCVDQCSKIIYYCVDQ